MKTKLLFVKRRFLIVLLFALALMFACLIAGATTSVAYAAGEHTDHSGWKTLSGTLNATTLSGNYVLTGDVTLAGDIGSNGNTVICLNGHKIKGENHSIDGSDIVTTTICDCTGSGQIQNAELYNITNINDITLLACEIYATRRETYLNGVSVNEGAIKVANKTIYINGGCSIRGISINGTEGCIYTDGYLDCNIYVTERTDVYINGGTVNGSIVVGTSGLFPTGDLYISGGTVNSSITVNEGSLCDISGGTIKGSVTVNNGTCNINGGTINSPITVNDEATCNISGGTITTSQYYSSDPGEIKGAVVVNSGTCTIGGTALITGNRVDYGAAVVVNGGTCNINGDNIVGNNATYGGLYISGGTCKISSDAVIRENQSFTNGGGIYMVGGTCNNYGTISDNYTNTGNGGGIYIAGGTCKNELSSLLQGNKATSGNGGGIYIGGGNFNSQGTITGNTAANGGGVYLSGADQQIIISGTISNNIASSKGGGIYLCDGTSFRSGANFTENRTYGNGGGIYAEAGSYLEIVISTFTKNDASVQGGAIYLDGSSGNLCTAILTSCTFVTNTAGSNIITSNLYAVYSEISIDNNMLPYDQPSSLVLKNSSFTITKGKYETNKIGTCFDLQGDSEIILAGGYYSTDPAQLFTIADDVRVVQIDENSGDKNYDAAYPWALYTVDNYEIYIRGTAKNPVYDGQPIEKDTDFTLTLTYPKVNNFYYWYKDQGADDSTYVYGLPTDAGSYTIRAGGPYFESTTTIWFWECTFDITIAKADPSYTVPTNVIARVDTPLSAVQLPDGWTWQDGSIIPDTEGTQTYTAIYTPSDTVNYNIIEADISVSVEHKHIGVLVEEVAATCTQNGVKAHYECSVCHELFEDSDCQTPIDDFDTWKVIPAIGHDFGDWTSNGDGTHTCTCQRDGCDATDTQVCSGGEATYFKQAECEVCGDAYGELKEDTTAPTGEITVSENEWSGFISNITFGLFCKDTFEVTISADDDSYYVDGYTADYAAAIGYYLYSGDTALTEEELADKEFTAYNGAFTVNATGKYVIYVRITDHAGNVTYLNSDGIVLYTDATQDTESITFIKTTTEDVVASVMTNGNTIKEIRNGSYTLTEDDYSVSYDGEKAIVTFTATYLTTLTTGEYTFAISYNPLGMDYIDAEGNVAPTDTRVVLNVIKQTGEVTDISDISRIYDDTAVSAPTYVSLSTGADVIEYKEKGADDSTYTTTAPKTVGEYTVRVTVAADADYEEASATKDFSITYLTVPQEAYSLNGTEGTKGWYRSEVTLTPAEGYTVATSLNGTYEARLIYNDYTDGVVIYLKNADGQMTDAITVGAVKIDKTAPDGDVKFAGNSVKEAFDEIDFGLFFNKNLDVEIVATDEESGAAKIEYFKSDKVLTEEEVAAITAWTTTESNFSITATDGEKFVCYVRITDTAGNVICFGAKGATFDLTAPAISGIQNGGTYCLSQSVTVTDDNLVSVTVNGTEMTEETFTLAVNEGTTYTIVATDIAGNVTEYTVTMKTVENLGESIADLTTGNVTSDNKNTVEEVKEVVETVDAANATETEKAALKEIADKCDELLQKIEEAAAACKTENIVNVDQITSDNVTPDDKENLVAAKEDLQNALEQYDGNLTTAEKSAIESKIANIDSALDAIDKAENPEGLSGGAIAGIVIGSVLGALIIAYGVCALLYKKKIVKGAFFEKIYPFIKD